MLRLAHISDTHLGKKQYGSQIRKQDYLDAFEECIDRCVELSVDAVIHTGDLFDDPNPDIDTLDETIRVLEKLEVNNIHFYGIVGNHERKRSGQWMDLIGRLSNTHRLSNSPSYIENDSGDSVVVYGFDAIRKNQWSTTDFSLTPPEEEFSESPKIVCFHELFTPPLQEITSDYEIQPVLESLTLTPDLVALGDNHEPTEAAVEMGDGTEVTAYYPGSTEKTSRNDPHTHSFTALAIDDDEIAKRSSVELDSPRPFISINITFTEGDGTEIAEQEIESVNLTTDPDMKDPVVVVKLQGENTGVTHNDIRRLLQNDSIAVLKIVDERVSTEFTIENETVDQNTKDIDTTITERIEQLELDEQMADIESIIRDVDNIPNSQIRQTVNDTFSSNEGDTQ